MLDPQGDPEAILRSVAFAAERLLRDDPWPERVRAVLEHLGDAAGADRAYVFANLRDPSGRLWMDLVCEWRAEGVPQLFEDPTNHLHPYAPDFVRWIHVLGEGGVIEGAVEDLPEESEQRVLASEGVASLAVAPVFVDEDWWGFVGLDDCGKRRPRATIELDALRATADAIGAALGRGRNDERRRMSEQLYRSLVEHIPAVTYIDDVNEQASALYISPQVETILGYTVEEWTGDPDLWPKILHPDDRVAALAENARHNETGEPFRLEYRVFTKDGRLVWIHDEAILVRDEHGTPRYSHGVMMDISERKRAEQHVAFLAYHDELTGLPNRTMFEELLEHSVARAKRHDGSVAVVCVDIDDFRLANDSLGHANGDELLRQVADRLREATRETDLVARRGGDQFLLLLADLEPDFRSEVDGAVLRSQSVVQRVGESLRSPFLVNGTELYLSASIGVCLFPHAASDGTSVLRNAESAMYESKKSGPGGFVLFSNPIDDRGGRLAFVTRLRKAAEARSWVLRYQPIVELEGGSTIGVEALIRWIEGNGSEIPPNDFIPVAEELGLIEPIGDWVVEEISRQDAEWRAQGLELEIGFNLSPRQFYQPDLADRILSCLHGSGVDPRRLTVEITESSLLDPDRAQRLLWALHDGGLRIAIDDFGTGYSSLSRLRQVPVDVLKIDRSFVRNVDRDAQSASIVSALIELARGLGTTVLAEGIETEEELLFLRSRGCTIGQGFLFSRPVTPEEILERCLRDELEGVPIA